MAGAAQHGSLPFAEQIKFFRDKKPRLSRAWTDVYAAEHDKAFAVAGAMKEDLLADFRSAIDKAISEGTTLDEFRRDFDDIVQRHGWAYKGGRGWRTRVIYDTNLRTSYAAGREAQMADPELRRRRPYGLYRHSGAEHPRLQHLAWDGLVLPLDDPWWSTHTPPNGWGCGCQKYMVSNRDVQRLGLKVADQAPPMEWEEKTVGIHGPNPRTVRVPHGIDPGFEYRPGASWVRALTPAARPALAETGLTGAAADALPAQSWPASKLLPTGLDDAEYVRRFLAEFDAAPDKPVVFKDEAGAPLTISDELFRDRATGDYVIPGSGRYLVMLADAVRSPQEIWVHSQQLDNGGAVVRRRYVKRYRTAEGDTGTAVFEWGRDGWSAVTTFDSDGIDNSSVRVGSRVWPA